MLRLELNHVSKRGPRYQQSWHWLNSLSIFRPQHHNGVGWNYLFIPKLQRLKASESYRILLNIILLGFLIMLSLFYIDHCQMCVINNYGKGPQAHDYVFCYISLDPNSLKAYSRPRRTIGWFLIHFFQISALISMTSSMEKLSILLVLCEGNHRSPVDFPHKGFVIRPNFWCFICSYPELAVTQTAQWAVCETPWSSCDVPVIVYYNCIYIYAYACLDDVTKTRSLDGIYARHVWNTIPTHITVNETLARTNRKLDPYTVQKFILSFFRKPSQC